MIPAVAIAEEGDPLPVRRGLRSGTGIAGHAPELLFHVLVNQLRVAAARVDDRRGPEMPGVNPASRAEAAAVAGRERPRRSSGRRHDHQLAGNVFADRVDDFGSAVRRRLLVPDGVRAGGKNQRRAVGRPAEASDRAFLP